MIPYIAERINDIQHSCWKHKVRTLWIFGSVLRPDVTPASDVDLLYELKDEEIENQHYIKNLFSWVDELEHIFGRKVDLIWYGGIKNPYFKEEIEETKVLLYDAEGEEVLI